MFPAYKSQESTSKCDEVDTNESFLKNPSYPVNQLVDISSSSEDEFSENDSETEQTEPQVYELVAIDQNDEDRSQSPAQSSRQNFYEDRERKKEYLKLDTLPSRSVPFYYKRKSGSLSSNIYEKSRKKFRRYFKAKRVKKLLQNPVKLLDDNTEKDEELRIYLIKNSHEIDKWIEYIEYKENYSKTPKEQNSKTKLEVIEKALHFNPNNSQLMRIYLETIPSVFSSSEVKKIIEDLIAKDLHNFMFWKSLIKNHLSSMSCEVENTMNLYEKSMNTLKKYLDSDREMLMLFKSCCLFFRQCGLNEQFFAVVHLMLSLNIKITPELDKTFYSNELQNPLLTEYEELILKSNLPMNELWYRMEILRSICNFLPVKDSGYDQMDDPQRFVFSEDICNLVNPLKKSHAYNFDLFIVILKLLKIPMPHRQIQNEIFEIEDKEVECGMDFLPIFLEKTFSCEKFDKNFYLITKDLNISPNYTNFNIENEAYFDVVSKILLLSCNTFNDRQNKIVLMIWLRFQRLSVVMDRMKLSLEKNPTEDLVKYKKLIKSRVKSALKNSKYQNDLALIKEYAMIEKSLGDDKTCLNILEMAIGSVDKDFDEIDFYSVVLEFCEQKLLIQDKEACLEKLKKFYGDNEEIFNFFNEKISLEKFEEPQEIEDYFLTNSNKFNLIKAKVFYILCVQTKSRALEEITNQINNCSGFLKEKLYEFYFWTFLLKWDNEVVHLKVFLDKAGKALAEYPKNLYILHSIASHRTLRWFDIRKLLLRTPTTESIFYLLLASKYHEDKYCDEENTKIYRHRIYNILDRHVSQHGNSSSILTWRLYLRAAFNHDFSKCKRILYEILDNYPMIKHLYLDGARYLPEEHSQLLDLIVEKGLRAHALAEELEILRTQSVD